MNVFAVLVTDEKKERGGVGGKRRVGGWDRATTAGLLENCLVNE